MMKEKNSNKKQFIRSIEAGICISLAGTVSLSIGSASMENKVIGAILFCFGLLTIIQFEYLLYTGAIGNKVFDFEIRISSLFTILAGNLVGIGITVLLIRFTYQYTDLHLAAQKVCETKLSQSPISMFINACICGALMYWATSKKVKENPNIRSFFVLCTCIIVFILSKFEHSIADSFYFAMGSSFSLKTLAYLLLAILGNTVGSSILACTDRIKTDSKKTL